MSLTIFSSSDHSLPPISIRHHDHHQLGAVVAGPVTAGGFGRDLELRRYCLTLNSVGRDVDLAQCPGAPDLVLDA